jgi:23S rRNA pseudouridine1911/1915/1917 synthase
VPASEVPQGAEGERLDRFLAELTGTPRNQVQLWIGAGQVQVDGAVAKPATRLVSGQTVAWSPPPPAPSELLPEAGELSLLYVDSHLVAVDKPAGLVVHPGAGRSTGTLAHRLLARFPEIDGVGGRGRPGIVHRLDRGTSGVMVVARSAEAYAALAKAFAGREVEKRYLAVVHGAPPWQTLEIDRPIGRHPTRRTEMAVRPRGRPSRSLARRLDEAPGASLLEVELATGRTHQIRVHLKSVGHPLVGDPVYGEARWKSAPPGARALLRDFPRPALHAWRLAFRHPATGEPLELEAPLPEDLVGLWRGLSTRDLAESLKARRGKSRSLGV